MSFTLVSHPGGMVFLDDDAQYLQTLAWVLPAQWHAEFFLRTGNCLQYLQEQTAHWEARAWAQQRMVERWREGSPLIPQVLAYWAQTPPEWQALTQVCAFDYLMPGLNGLQALAQLGSWQGARALLTGQADEQVAVKAFNQGLIECFIPKQLNDDPQHLIQSLRQLMLRPHPRLEQIWRSTLTAAQDALLRHAKVQADLASYAQQHWVAHVVIGQPWGMLGLTDQGQATWLQLEQHADLPELAELAQAQGLDDSVCLALERGEQLVSLELQQALGEQASALAQPAFAVGESLLGACFHIDPGCWHAGVNSRKAWLSNLGARRVRD